MVVHLKPEAGDQVVLFMQNLGYYVKFCYITVEDWSEEYINLGR